MKKVLVFGLVCTLFLTGCGGKKLTCTITDDTMFDMEGKIVLTFDGKGEEIKKGSFNVSMEVGEEYAEYMDEVKEEIESEYEDLKEFTDLEVKTNDNVVKVSIEYNTKNLTEDQIDELHYAGLYADENYEDTKAHFEEEGYTCK